MLIYSVGVRNIDCSLGREKWGQKVRNSPCFGDTSFREEELLPEFPPPPRALQLPSMASLPPACLSLTTRVTLSPIIWRVFNSPISDLDLRFGILIYKLKCKLGL